MLFDLFGKSGDQLAKEGIEEYRKGKDEFAVIAKLEKAIKVGLKNYPIDQVYLHIGASYFDLALFEKAKDAYETASSYNRNDPTILSNLGLAYKELGYLEKSIDYFVASLKLKPDNAYAHNNIGLYLYEKGEYFSAIESLNRAIEINPGLAVSYSLKARCLAYIGKRNEAMICLREAIKKGYNNGDVQQSEMNEIDANHPRTYWRKDKFTDFVEIISGNDADLINQVNSSLAGPKAFFDSYHSMFEHFNLTAFEIQNAIQWFLVFERLKASNKLAEIKPDENNKWVIDEFHLYLAEKLFSEEIAQEVIDEAIGQKFSAFMMTIACRLKLTYGLTLLDIWTSTPGVIVCLMTDSQWKDLQYPFVDVDDGFGKIGPIATDEDVRDFLLKQE